MNKLGKQVTPEELAHQVTQYLLVLRDISVKLDGYREVNEKYPGWVRSAVILKRQWQNFIAHGRELAWAILGSKEIPKGQEKSIEISARLFTVSNRMPNDPIGWFDKNFPPSPVALPGRPEMARQNRRRFGAKVPLGCLHDPQHRRFDGRPP